MGKQIAIYGMGGSMGSRLAKLITALYPQYNILDGRKKDVYTETVFIATPTETHLDLAIDCITNRGANHVWVEKPLGLDIDKAFQLCGIAKKHNTTVYVAYPLRFHPKLIEAHRIAKDGSNIKALCTSDASRWSKRCYASQGGGAILELSHEIDYVCRICGLPVEMKGFVTMHKSSDIDQTAHIYMKHQRGITSSLYLDINCDTESRVCTVDDAGFNLLPLPDIMRENQLHYFMANKGNQKMINNIHEATELLSHILKFREISYGTEINYFCKET